MSPRLTVQRPSPTTVLFTASNAPARRTWSSKLAFGIEILLRILGFLSVLLVNFAKARRFMTTNDGNWGVSPELWTTSVGSLTCRIADHYTWPIVAVASALVTYSVWRKGYTGLFIFALLICLTCIILEHQLMWSQRSPF